MCRSPWCCRRAPSPYLFGRQPEDNPLAENGPATRNDTILRIVGWVATGAAAAGAATFGVLANQEAAVLIHERNAFPSAAGTLRHDAGLTMTYSILADSLTGAAVVIGGVTLLSTLLSRSSTSPLRGSGSEIMLGPSSMRFETRF